MCPSTAIHTTTVGSVTATVHRVEGYEVAYYVTLSSGSSTKGDFLPEELSQVVEAAEQARMFICYQEQVSRMNWCPGCGG